MRRLLWACCTVAVILALADLARAEVVRLRDGRLLQGKIVSHSGVELVLQRWDTGGEVVIPFKEMLAEDRKRIEEKLGYRSLEGYVKTVSGHRLILKSGVAVLGVMDEKRSNDSTVVLERRGIVYRYERSQVAKIEPIQVPAGEVYTAKRTYELERDKMNPQSARDHYELARYAESLNLYEEALDHFKTASALDPTNWKTRTDAAIVRLEAAIKNKEALAAYRAVLGAMARNEYDKARELLKAVEKDHPDAKFPKELAKLSEEIDSEEKLHMNRLVLRYLYMIGRNKAYEAARQQALTIEEALAYGQGQMHKDVLSELAKRMGVDEKRAQQAFNERDTSSIQKHALGSGTFLLGNLAVSGDGKPGAGGPGAGSQGGRFGGNQGQGGGGGYTVKVGGQTITIPQGLTGGGRAGGQGGGQGQQNKPDPRRTWWQYADSGARRMLIYGAWVAKHLTIVRLDKTHCSDCAGEGIVETFTPSGRIQKTCDRCQGAKYDVELVYK